MNRLIIFFLTIGLATACNNTQGVRISSSDSTTGTRTFKAEVWGDNWFAFYLGDTLVKEDSVPITTERSFNSETFTFKADYPLQINIIAKDFKANDTGLEYIGTRRQQMGDGGFIAQITDMETGQIVAVTNGQWRAMVVHKAPLDAGCADVPNPVAGVGPCQFQVTPEPANWKFPDFDASNWPLATEHSVSSVRPKDGYDKINWNSAARIIWGTDLEKDNTILLRYSVSAPQ